MSLNLVGDAFVFSSLSCRDSVFKLKAPTGGRKLSPSLDCSHRPGHRIYGGTRERGGNMMHSRHRAPNGSVGCSIGSPKEREQQGESATD